MVFLRGEGLVTRSYLSAAYTWYLWNQKNHCLKIKCGKCRLQKQCLAVWALARMWSVRKPSCRCCHHISVAVASKPIWEEHDEALSLPAQYLKELLNPLTNKYSFLISLSQILHRLASWPLKNDLTPSADTQIFSY